MPIIPIKQEDEYYVRLEFDRAKKAEQEREKRLRLKELIYMLCPKCDMQLVEIDYRGIKIKKCTACDGVWLDAEDFEMVSQIEESLVDKFFDAFLK